MGVTGGNDAFAAAHPAQGCGGLQSEFPSVVGNEIGDFMAFEVAPHVFGGIEFWRIGWQPLDLDAAPGGGDIVPDQNTAVNRSAIPENEYFTANLPLEVSEKADDLEALDAARMNLEVEPPKRQAANDREAFPVEGLLKDGRLSARSPGPKAQVLWRSSICRGVQAKLKCGNGWSRRTQIRGSEIESLVFDRRRARAGGSKHALLLV